MPDEQNQTTDTLACARRQAAPRSIYPEHEMILMMADEIEQLRALVKRVTDVAANLAEDFLDPGTEALAAIHCGRNMIYG